MRCRLQHCQFAQAKLEYLGHVLSWNGIEKGSKVNDVLLMPPPHDVSSLRSFLGSVQFYGKFLPSHASTVAEPLHQLTRKGVPWRWESVEDQAFQRLKTLLSSDKVLVHFDPTLPVGISCDASHVGIGAVLFHCFPDASERPIANALKTLPRSQRNYSHIQKEAMTIVYALKKFYHYLFGRRFIIVAEHKPLLTLFGPEKATPSLAANRLACWALFLNQFSYQIVYRKSSKHQNAEMLRSVTSSYEVGDPCYALYYGPQHSHQPRWVPAIVTKRHGTRSVNVRVLPRGPTVTGKFFPVTAIAVQRPSLLKASQA